MSKLSRKKSTPKKTLATARDIGFPTMSFKHQLLRLKNDDNNRTKLKKKIENLKHTYKFKDECDLLFHLEWHMVSGVLVYEDAQKKNPRAGQIKSFLKELQKTAEQAQQSLSRLQTLLSNSGKIRGMLNEVIDKKNEEAFNETIHYLEAKANEAKTKKDKRPYEKELAFIIERKNENSPNFLKVLEKDLDNFYTNNNDNRLRQLIKHANLLSNSLEDIGGKKPGSLPKKLISYLAPLFREATGNMPTCGQDAYKGHYTGKFYYFLLELKKIFMNSIPKISLGTDSTIWKYTKEVIKDYKKSLRKNG